MCTLNHLKKKLHLHKCIQFFGQYSHIIFYHCNRGTRPPSNSLITPGILFLGNSARIRQLSPNAVTKNSHVERNKRDNRWGGKEIADAQFFSPSVKKPYIRDRLWRDLFCTPNTLGTDLASPGALGTCVLVGCKSLQAMQSVIADNSAGKNEKNVDCVCLGAISNHAFTDHLDCLRLSEMPLDINKMREKLPHTLVRVQSQLLGVLPGVNKELYFLLMVAREKKLFRDDQ